MFSKKINLAIIVCVLGLAAKSRAASHQLKTNLTQDQVHNLTDKELFDITTGPEGQHYTPKTLKRIRERFDKLLNSTKEGFKEVNTDTLERFGKNLQSPIGRLAAEQLVRERNFKKYGTVTAAVGGGALICYAAKKAYDWHQGKKKAGQEQVIEQQNGKIPTNDKEIVENVIP